MIPPSIDYHRATGVDEAVDLLSSHADRNAAVLAGGHGLVPDMKTGAASPSVLVDVRDVSALRGVERVDDGSALRIGALTTHGSLVDHDLVRRELPLLRAAAERVGDLQVRNRGTLGGNLAEADPRADLPPAVLATGATLAIRGPDGRDSREVASFFEGDGETALSEAELLTAVRVPTGEGGAAYRRKTHPASGYAMVSAAVRLRIDDGRVDGARVAVGGLVDPPCRLSGVETELTGSGTVEAAREAAAAGTRSALEGDIDADRFRGDEHASAEYRRGILPTYVERAVADAIETAPGDLDD